MHCDWSARVLYNSTRHAAYIWCVPYNSLSQFYIEAWSKRGEEYSKSSLISFRNAIERHLNKPPYNKSLKLISASFANSNCMLNAKIKSLNKQGKENVQHKDAIPVDDLKKLKAGPVLCLTNPWSLLRNVWFHVVLYWCRRGGEGQRNLKPSSFKLQWMRKASATSP